MLYIITTLDECGALEYETLIRSVRAQTGGMRIRLVCLYGTLEPETEKRLSALTDDIQCFQSCASSRYFTEHYGDRVFHPLGKLAKLFFAREYVERHASPGDPIAFLDPDVYVQRPLREFAKLVKRDRVLFGHEIQMIHHAHRDNLRLKVAELFDKPGPWKNTYFTEINTGVNLSFAASFLKLMGDFEDFMKGSDYFRVLDQVSDDVKWHDQDFFRYFYRKTQRPDIDIFDLDKVFTTTMGGAKCLYYDTETECYRTVWGEKPFAIHFAGGTMARIPRLSPEKNLVVAPVEIQSLAGSNGTPSEARKRKTPAARFEFAPEPFPLDRHAIYLRPNMRYLAERWLRRLSEVAQVLLLADPAATEDADRLKKRFDQITDIVLLPEKSENGAPPRLSSKMTDESALDSVVLPMPSEGSELQFLPKNHLPKLGPHYELFRTLWRVGFRRFALHSYAGTKVIELPWLLDSFVNRHKGKRCFVVGNGPSLNEIDMTLLKNEITFGSNRCFLGYEKWGFDFTYWGVMDRLQVEEYGTEYEDNVPSHTPKFFPFEYANLFEFENACPVNFSYDGKEPYKFSGSPDLLHLGFTVTHMHLQIAVIMGCNPIYLIGCDHRYHLDDSKKKTETKRAGLKGAEVWAVDDAKGATHFTNQYTGGEEKKIFITPKPERMEGAFEVARKWCEARGIRIINATPNTGLKVFPLADYASLFPESSPKKV